MSIKNFQDFLQESKLSPEELESALNICAILEEIESEQGDELNEGWKEVVLGGLLSLLTVGGVSAQASNPQVSGKSVETQIGKDKYTTLTQKWDFKLDKEMTKEKADARLAQLLANGWKLDSAKMDTLFQKVIKEAPDTAVQATQIKFDDATFFESGKFELSSKVKADIDSAIANILKQTGTIIKINIISSTDKQGLSQELQAKLKSMGYTPDNQGLSKARATSMINYLSDAKQINKTLITQENLAEQGEKEIDQSARYVTVQIMYLVRQVKPGKIEVKEPKTVNYIAYVTKTFKEEKEKKEFKINFPNINISLGTAGSHKNWGSVKCPN